VLHYFRSMTLRAKGPVKPRHSFTTLESQHPMSKHPPVPLMVHERSSVHAHPLWGAVLRGCRIAMLGAQPSFPQCCIALRPPLHIVIYTHTHTHIFMHMFVLVTLITHCRKCSRILAALAIPWADSRGRSRGGSLAEARAICS
jgi:hypothetical protein